MPAGGRPLCILVPDLHGAPHDLRSPDARHLPGRRRFDAEALAECIAACLDCTQTCTACADACLAEEQVAELRHCVTLDLNCADVCAATEPLPVRIDLDALV